MSETALKEKKKWSKKKKVVFAIIFVFIFLICAALIGGVIALNKYCETADYTVQKSAYTESDVNLIAHRGFRAVAPENTTASFEKAGENNFFGAECDVYRTADGVWIISHDTSTYRMMDKTASIEKTTYKDLMEQTVDNGSNIADYPDLKICTLEEYLDICNKYSMRAVIELKGKNNTEYYNEIIDMVNEKKADAMFISFHIENLQKMRELTDAPLWYLVQKIDDEEIETALSLGGECGIDFNYSKEENNAEMIEKCISKGLEVGAWTVDDVNAMNTLVKEGVTNITTDSITY